MYTKAKGDRTLKPSLKERMGGGGKADQKEKVPEVEC